jgi:multiple sugar transport system ATP-binding protein
MNRIVVKDLQKDFFSLRRGRIRALHALDLTVAPGSFFVLVGPSGCGKSTLLNVLAGIEKPSTGEVWIGDRRVVCTAEREFVPPRQRDVAMVFQSYALYPHMSVFDNIAFPLKIARHSKDGIRRRVRRAAAVLEIEDLLEARPSELSGGQRQRVALGRAIVRQPKALLLDEPLSNLDALLRTSMRGELKRLQRRLKVTTLYVTHDQTEAMALGDRIAVLKDGRLQQTGTPEEIYHQPENSFVARFIGTPPMNLLDGRLLEKAGNFPALSGKVDPCRVQIGLRPEHLRITNETEGLLRARLELITPLGNEALIYLDVDGHQMLAKSRAFKRLEEKQVVGIDFNPQHLFVFRKQDGLRLDTVATAGS